MILNEKVFVKTMILNKNFLSSQISNQFFYKASNFNEKKFTMCFSHRFPSYNHVRLQAIII